MNKSCLYVHPKLFRSLSVVNKSCLCVHPKLFRSLYHKQVMSLCSCFFFHLCADGVRIPVCNHCLICILVRAKIHFQVKIAHYISKPHTLYMISVAITLSAQATRSVRLCCIEKESTASFIWSYGISAWHLFYCDKKLCGGYGMLVEAINRTLAETMLFRYCSYCHVFDEKCNNQGKSDFFIVLLTVVALFSFILSKSVQL